MSQLLRREQRTFKILGPVSPQCNEKVHFQGPGLSATRMFLVTGEISPFPQLPTSSVAHDFCRDASSLLPSLLLCIVGHEHRCLFLTHLYPDIYIYMDGYLPKLGSRF